MDDQITATLTNPGEKAAFEELTAAIRDSGFDVTASNEATSDVEIRVPDGYDDQSSERVLDIAYQNRVESDAKEFIRTLVATDRLYDEVPGSIRVQSLSFYEEVIETIALDGFNYKMVLECSEASPPPVQHIGESADKRISKELTVMYAKDVAKRAQTLVEGTEQNGWTPQWDAIKTNDEYECYVYDEEADSEM